VIGLAEEYVHGLSLVEFHHESIRDLPAFSRALQSDRDHRLDGLALLFVFSSKGDMAATSYWRSADKLKLLWAKNQPVDDNQIRYTQELLEKVKKGTKASELLDIVISMCCAQRQVEGLHDLRSTTH
jgi:hypothetical protein